MQPPRWFYTVLAACAIVLTLSLTSALLSLTYRLRYTTDPANGALIDHWHRTYCLTGGCVSFDDTTNAAGGMPSSTSNPRDTASPLAPSQQPVSLDSMMRPRRDSR